MRRRVLPWVLVVALLGACTAPGPDPQSDESPARTQSVPAESRSSPSGSPSPVAADGPLISWDFVFKGNIPQDLRRTVRFHTERATNFFAALELGLAREDRFVEVYGEASPYDSETDFCGQLTEAGGIRIYLLSCRQTDAGSRVERVETITHEVFHALQQRVIEANDLKPNVFLDGMLPHWFKEGAATWASAIAMDEWGFRSYEASRDIAVAEAELVNAPLRKLETGKGWFDGDITQQIAQYGLAFLGVESAADRDWVSSLQVYGRAVSEQVPDWPSAFEETFEVDQKDFYKSFERDRDKGFPKG